MTLLSETVRRPRFTVGRAWAYVALVALLLVAVFPILWLVLTSLMPSNLIMRSTPTLVFTPTFEHFAAIFGTGRGAITTYLVNSVIVTLVSTVCAVALAIFAAYGIARVRPRGHEKLSLLILTSRMLPPVGLVVPMYLIARNTGLLDTHLALILPYIAINIPLATWMLQGFFMDLPKELEEAAMIDGCGRVMAFVRVVLPLAGPGIAAVSVFCFVLAWNDMVLALPLTLRDAVTLPPFMSQVRQEEGVAWGQLGATTVVVMAPVILFTLAVQRWIVSGLTAGAAKG